MTGSVVFEIAAISLYFTDLFPEKKLGPRMGDPRRGEYLSWLAYRPGVIEPAMMMRRLKVKHVQGGMGWAEAGEVEATLNSVLSGASTCWVMSSPLRTSRSAARSTS